MISMLKEQLQTKCNVLEMTLDLRDQQIEQIKKESYEAIETWAREYKLLQAKNAKLQSQIDEANREINNVLYFNDGADYEYGLWAAFKILNNIDYIDEDFELHYIDKLEEVGK